MCGKIASRGSSPACGLAPDPAASRASRAVGKTGSIRSGEAMAGSSGVWCGHRGNLTRFALALFVAALFQLMHSIQNHLKTALPDCDPAPLRLFAARSIAIEKRNRQGYDNQQGWPPRELDYRLGRTAKSYEIQYEGDDNHRPDYNKYEEDTHYGER
jgi:hypothetical protein